MSLIRVRSRTLSTLANYTRLHQKHDEFTQHTEDSKRQDETKRQRFDKDEEIRGKILDAALGFVPETGWTKEAIEKGIDKLEMPKISTGIVQNGPIDLVHFHYEKSNSLLGNPISCTSPDLNLALF